MVGARFARIALCPGFAGPLCGIEVPRHESFVVYVDKEPFLVAGAIAQLPSPQKAGCSKIGLVEIGIDSSEGSVRHGELRIDFCSTLKKRQGCRRATDGMHLPAGTVCSQRIQG